MRNHFGLIGSKALVKHLLCWMEKYPNVNGDYKTIIQVMCKDTLDQKVYPMGNHSMLGKEKFLVCKDTRWISPFAMLIDICDNS